MVRNQKIETITTKYKTPLLKDESIYRCPVPSPSTKTNHDTRGLITEKESKTGKPVMEFPPEPTSFRYGFTVPENLIDNNIHKNSPEDAIKAEKIDLINRFFSLRPPDIRSLRKIAGITKAPSYRETAARNLMGTANKLFFFSR
jgi:hypothetical protein